YRLSGEDKIVVDGLLNESSWWKAEHKGNFLEKEPFPLIPMIEESEFAILYDDENLYIGVWCWDSEPHKIIQQLSPRGTTAPDHLMLFVDSYHDHRTGYKFSVSPTGVQLDELRYDDVKRDNNWNGIWYSEGTVDEKGWYAEVKIPFFNFRYPPDSSQTWGFNIMRNISKNASRGQWKPHLPEWDNTTRMSQMGNIENIRNISSGRTFEIRPYGVASLSESVNQNPLRTFSFGGDVRYSPSPNLTVDFTFNPDFAQVDADVFEINLTRFPTRFKELRPFFTERINIFNTPLELFYSRRIGAIGDILGGIKMTGKLQHGIEFGALGNLTGESLFSSSLQNTEKALFGVMRVKKDIFGSSNVGIIGATKEEGENYNRIVGFDGSIMLNRYNLVDFQIASGQTEMEYDRNMAYNVVYVRTGDLMGYKINFDRTEPAFEINRVGYIQKEADRGWNKWMGLYRISPRINKYHIRRITANLTYENKTDLFTSRYINRWLEFFPDLIPDQKFGTVIQSDANDRLISEGAREINNFESGGDITINLINEMSLFSEFKYFSDTELTGSYSGNSLKMSYATRPLSLGTRFAGIVTASRGTLYNFNQKYVGSQKSLSVDGEGRFMHNIISVIQSEFTKTFNPDNENDGRYFKLSSNTTWMFTKDFFFRLHLQGIFGTTFYDQKQVYNDYLLSGLLSWEYRPGSFLYLAYNEARYDNISPQTNQNLEFLNRTIVLKLSYFFSI
ncbi:MAG TPA: DUF5916 domain-containing protein, partial [Mariniphaga sp.]|nr:DUF5916 domain-containing protein [Mariniphaga sp.]